MGVAVGVAVGSSVGVAVEVAVGVIVGVAVGVWVTVAVGVSVGGTSVSVGGFEVLVGSWVGSICISSAADEQAIKINNIIGSITIFAIKARVFKINSPSNLFVMSDY